MYIFKETYIYIDIYPNFIKHNRHFMSTYFLWIRSNSHITFIVFWGN